MTREMKIKAVKRGWGSRSVKRLLRKMELAGIEWPHHLDDTRIKRLSGGSARWQLETENPPVVGEVPWIGSDDRVSDCLKGCMFTPFSKTAAGYWNCNITADSILEEMKHGTQSKRIT